MKLFTVINIYALPALVVALKPAFKLHDRDVYNCPTSCGGGWCCDVAQICRPTTLGDNPYVCADTQLHGTDGGSATFDAYNPNSIFQTSLLSSLNISLTGIPTPLPTERGPANRTAIPTTIPSTPTSTTKSDSLRFSVNKRVFWGSFAAVCGLPWLWT